MIGHDGGPNIGAAERILSVVGGAGLAAEGIRQTVVKNRKSGLLLALAGGYCVVRGLSGRCAMYRMLGASPSPQFPSKETGEVATNISPAAREIAPPAHPPAAMMPPQHPRREKPRAFDWHAENEPRRGKVEIASEDSFPASDAPAWTSDRR